MVIDRRNSVCDCRKATSNGHWDRHYLDVSITFTNFNSFATSYKRMFAIYFVIDSAN